MHIECRRWFGRTNGNTYHSVVIHFDAERSVDLGIHYGYDEQCLQTALDWLKANGHAPEDAEYGTRYLREELGASYSIADVARERDL